MASTEKHIEISLARTGKEYADLHRWINEGDLQFERHDFTRVWDLIPEVQARFGDEGVREYIEHLRVDMEMKLTNTWGKEDSMRDAALTYFGIKRKIA